MKIYNLFSSYRCWTKKISARKQYITLAKLDVVSFIECDVTDEKSSEAQCWCLLGAVNRCYPRAQRSRVLSQLLDAINDLFPKRFKYCGSVVSFNDDESTRFADVMRVVRKAKV